MLVCPEPKAWPTREVPPMKMQGLHGRELTVGEGQTRIMGIVNVTPDSFSEGGSLSGFICNNVVGAAVVVVRGRIHVDDRSCCWNGVNHGSVRRTNNHVPRA